MEEHPHAFCPYCKHDLGEVTKENIKEEPYDCPSCGKLIKHNKTIAKLFGMIDDE